MKSLEIVREDAEVPELPALEDEALTVFIPSRSAKALSSMRKFAPPSSHLWYMLATASLLHAAQARIAGWQEALPPRWELCCPMRQETDRNVIETVERRRPVSDVLPRLLPGVPIFP